MDATPTPLPIHRLGAALRQQGVCRFFEQLLERFPTSHMKDLAVEAMAGRWMEAEGRRVINFGSDSFLGLDQDARVQAALVRGIEKWGTHNGGSRAFSSVQSNVEAEERLARWLGTEAALIYPSVTLANHGAIPGLATRADVVVVDEQAHNSIQEGTRLAQAGGARTALFAHDDADDLKRVLKQLRPYRFAMVAVDGIYSMSGTLPPLRDFQEVALEHDAILYVDDAHGTGVLGQQGRGTVLESLGSYDNTLIAGSLSKAFSCFGGFLGCPAAFHQLLKIRSNTYIFGGPVPPPYLEAILTVLDIIESPEYEELRGQLDANIDRFVSGVARLGLALLGGIGPIVAILVGSEADTFRAGRFLFDQGYYVQSVVFPAVPYRAGVLRIQLNANHDAAMVDGLLDALAALERIMPLPSADQLSLYAATPLRQAA
jgi:7-keto-8-aminopelargonate synthetase-like enzyme